MIVKSRKIFNNTVEYVCRPDPVRWVVWCSRLYRSLLAFVIYGMVMFAGGVGVAQIAVLPFIDHTSMTDFIVAALFFGPFALSAFILSLIQIQRLARQWLWYFNGRETITVTPWSVEIVRRNVFSRYKKVEMKDIFSVGFRPIADDWFDVRRLQVNPVRKGDIVLETRQGDVRFGCNLDDLDNLKIAERINAHVPQNRTLREIWRS